MYLASPAHGDPEITAAGTRHSCHFSRIRVCRPVRAEKRLMNVLAAKGTEAVSRQMKMALFVGDMRIGGVTTFALELLQILMKAGNTVKLEACGRGVWLPRLAENAIPAVSLPPNRW